MPLYDVAVLVMPTEDGEQEELAVLMTGVIADGPKGAERQVLLENAELLRGKAGRLEVLVRPFT